jgi:hypothetical protein
LLREMQLPSVSCIRPYICLLLSLLLPLLHQPQRRHQECLEQLKQVSSKTSLRHLQHLSHCLGQLLLPLQTYLAQPPLLQLGHHLLHCLEAHLPRRPLQVCVLSADASFTVSPTSVLFSVVCDSACSLAYLKMYFVTGRVYACCLRRTFWSFNSVSTFWSSNPGGLHRWYIWLSDASHFRFVLLDYQSFKNSRCTPPQSTLY